MAVLVFQASLAKDLHFLFLLKPKLKSKRFLSNQKLTNLSPFKIIRYLALLRKDLKSKE